MEKLKVFLDSSVLIHLLSGQSELLKLFSDEVLSKVTYITSPIAFQELLFAIDGTDKELNLGRLEENVCLVPVEPEKLDSTIKKELRRFRNLAVHGNDVLLIGTAEASNSDYFLTYDKKLMKAVENTSIKAESPEEFIESLKAA